MYLQVQKQNVYFTVSRLRFLITMETPMGGPVHFCQLGKLPIALYRKTSGTANFSLTLLLSY